MRVMVIVKATKNSEAGKMPSSALLAAMGKYNEELVKAGIMQGGDGLKPSSLGKRVKFTKQGKTVEDGPFSGPLVSGFWMWKVKSMEEALDWARRCPDPMPGEEAELEIRPIFEAEDFGEAFTPEMRDREAKLRKDIEGKKKG